MHIDGKHLYLDRCPHCNVSNPNLVRSGNPIPGDESQILGEYWITHQCSRCHAVALVQVVNGEVERIWPESKSLSEDIPARARKALQDARDAISTPSLSVVGSARAIDFMLKEKGYKTGSLYARINKAAEDHLITEDMKSWAHEVRLEANDERHADEDADEATTEEAVRVLGFAEALAELLFELPARVQRGRGPGVSEP